MRKRMAIVGVLGAVSLSALIMATDAHALSAQAANPNQGVVSDGKVIPAVEVLRTFSPSSLGRRRTATSLDSLANRKARVETAAEAAALLRKQPVSASPNPESVIGTDTRTLVSPTTTYPASATALISFSAGRCTGWLINANTVVTAGHCVHPGGGGSFYPTSSYLIYPGRNGTSSPYGSCTARWLASVNGWTV